MAGVERAPPAANAKTTSTEPGWKPRLKKIGKGLLYVLAAGTALFLIKHFFFTPADVVITQVRQEHYVGEVQGTGTISVDVLAQVGAKIPGRIERVLVNEGDFVRSGQVVATLEDTDIRQVLARSQARLEVARMTEQASHATVRSAHAAATSLRAASEARRATSQQADRAWARERHLVAVGAVSQEEADQYDERARTAVSAVASADADVGAALAQIDAAAARVRANHSEIAAAEAEVELQQFNLSQTKIFTYVSGVVVDRPRRSGDAIVSGQTVLTVADPAVILVEAYLDQRFASQVRIGQTATVKLRGATEQIAGRVYRIRPQADAAAEEMTVEISFPLPPGQLQIGQWADVYVQVTDLTDALVVPKTAVLPMGEGRVILVADGESRVRQVEIHTLATSPRSSLTAVAGELKAGEWVLWQPAGVHAGQKVRTVRSSGTPGAGAGAKMPEMKM